MPSAVLFFSASERNELPRNEADFSHRIRFPPTTVELDSHVNELPTTIERGPLLEAFTPIRDRLGWVQRNVNVRNGW
jgi:hypothetical protein